MASSNALTTRFAADISQFEKELKRLQNLNAKTAAKLASDQARAAQRTAKAWNDNDPSKVLSRQISSMRSEISRFAPVLAGLFGTAQVASAADAWTRFTNTLKVAGVATADLSRVQGELYTISQENGAAIESIGTLYGRTTAAAGALGASQEDVMKFTDAVALALRAQGGSAQEADNALIQLAQGLGDAKLAWEDMASVADGAGPLFNAAAAGSAKWGGDVAKLKREMRDGKVATKDFFDAVLAGKPVLDQMAGKSATTLAQAFTGLSNSFTKYVGEANGTVGATSVLISMVQTLANNLPTVANAIALIGLAYGATLIPTVARATTAFALNAATVAATGAVYSATTRQVLLGATAMNTAKVAATGLSTALGGPLGIALTGITVAMSLWAYQTAQAKQQAAELAGRVDDLGEKLGTAEKQSLNAAAGTDAVTKASVLARAKANGLAVDIGKLADKYGILAENARQAAYEIAKADVQKAEAAYNTRLEKERDSIPVATTWGRDPMDRKFGNNRAATIKQPTAEEAMRGTEEERVRNRARANLLALKDPKTADDFRTTPPPPAAVDPKKGGKGAKPTPSDGTSENRELEIERRQLLLQETTDLGERLRIQKEILDLQTDGKIDAIDQRVKSGQLRKAAGESLKAKEIELSAIEASNLEAENARDVAERKTRIAEQETTLSAEALRSESDDLEQRARRARTTQKRHELELAALDKRQEADRLEFDLSQRQYEADMKILGLTEEKIRAMLAQREAIFKAGQTRDSTDKQSDHSRDDPSVKGRIVQRADSFGTLNAQLGDIATGGLDRLTSGLTDAVMGAKSLKEAFTDMAKSMIAQLIEMAIRFVIFEAIGKALGVSGLGKSALGISKQPTTSVSIGANAMGTNHWKGGLSMVGEKGPELMYIPAGGQIAPNNLLSTALRQNTQPMQANGGLTLNTTVNATDAVLTSTVKGWISESQVQAVQAAEKMTNRSQTKRNRNTLIR